MSTALAEPRTERTTSTTAAQRLRSQMAAVRISLSWFGTKKTLTPDQKAEAADTFDASQQYLSASKKLLDTGHAAYKAVTTVKGQVKAYWRGLTLPFPEPGIRLIRQQDVQSFCVHMTTLQAELYEAVEELDAHYAELCAAARRKLGKLYSPLDYPDTLKGLFDVSWDFPSVEAPDYLRQLHPQLFEQEQARVAARFEEAVKLAEEAFVEELSKLVSHLTERLSGQEDGRPKIFRDSAVENLTEFFQRFRSLNVRSSEDLDNLVAQAQRVVRGIEPQALRDDGTLRQRVASQLAGVQSVLDGLLVDRPRRNILRRAK